MKAVSIDPDLIRPIPSEDDSFVCVSCLLESARWVVGTKESCEPWCASCFLYITEWGKSQAREIDELAVAYENTTGKSVREGGKIVFAECDRILFGIVMAAAAMKARKARAQRASDGT